MVRSRKHRLPPEHYQGRVSVSFTLCVRSNDGQALTIDPVFQAIQADLTSSSQAHGCLVPIFCLMPDQLHVVMFGATEDADTLSAIRLFKHRSGSWYYYHTPNFQWQRSFYDHIVRASEGYAKHIRYVALNPVRKGLCADIASWPFTGSFGMNLDEVMLDAFWD